MKKILQNTCILAALMILAVFVISIIWSGVTAEIKLVLQLFGLALSISILNYIFDEFTSLSILMNYIVKYFAITGVVMLFGFIVGWFFPNNFWMAFIYVGAVLVMLYLIDGFKVKKDIEYINQQIIERETDKVTNI